MAIRSGCSFPVRSVGVMGDERTYANVLALRAVYSKGWLTADWVPLAQTTCWPPSSSRIVERGCAESTAWCYDISSKPPATIEWEWCWRDTLSSPWSWPS